MHDSLLHGEALLVVAAGDAENVAFEFVADAVALDFGTHAAFHEDAEFALIFDFDELLRAVGRVGDVQLHLDGWWDVKMRVLRWFVVICGAGVSECGRAGLKLFRGSRAIVWDLGEALTRYNCRIGL